MNKLRALCFLAITIIGFSVAANGQVTPKVNCVLTDFQTGTVKLTSNAGAGASSISVDGVVPIFASLIINPGGANQETARFVGAINGSNPYVMSLFTVVPQFLGNTSAYGLVHNHSAGEMVQYTLINATAFFGYNNAGSTQVSRQPGGSQNFFSPVFQNAGQPANFDPGVHDRVFSYTYPLQAIPNLTWTLQNITATVTNDPSQFCGGVITYQGKLTDGSGAANAAYDIRFTLFSALTGGNQIGPTVTQSSVQVSHGLFATQLDFGQALFGNLTKYMEISVSPAGANTYTTLSPRQQITSVPNAISAQIATYANTAGNANTATTAATATNAVNAANAIHATSADTATDATNAAQLGGVSASQYLITTLANSSFIQNQTAGPQTADFNVSGNGTVGGTLSAAQFNIGINRVLSIGDPTLENTFIGFGSGQTNPTGNGNSFIGRNAGQGTTTGSFNSFIGQSSGTSNTTGNNNVFLGAATGIDNNADDNTFVGTEAGRRNTAGTSNSFFGRRAGSNNLTGQNNLFLGNNAGTSNTTENDNTFIGTGANGAAGVNNATAIGAGTQVKTSNTMVLGTNAVTVQVPGNLTVTGTLNANLANGGDSFIQNTTSQQSNSNFNVSGSGTVGGNLTVAGTLNATLPTGSANYVQNSTSQQSNSNFNISGNGTVGGNLTVDGTLNATLPTGSGNYIQNSSTQQSSGNFNISGNGTVGGTVSANVVNAGSQYNINDFRVFSLGGTASTFAGLGAGLTNPTGDNNTFFGRAAGRDDNTGSSNSFVGTAAGRGTTTGSSNSFFGHDAGINNITGSNNTFFGTQTGQSNTSENNNTFIGFAANGAAGITNATAIGANAQVATSNTMVLGTNAVTVQVPGNLTVTGTLNAALPGGSGNYVQNSSTQQANSNFNISGNGTVGGSLTVAGALNATLPSGSGNYVQNSTTQQANSNFNISGNGTVGGSLTVTGALNATLPSGSGNYVQNSSTQQTNSNFNISGNGTIGGSLTVTGALNATLPSGSTNYIHNSITQQSGTNFNISGSGTIGGNLNVSGNLTKGGGSFKIDHPLDPANKYLYHSFVESPDMMNIYNGIVTLDKRGQAIVTMPEWFEALNRDFRYQLTPIGAPGPNLYIATEIKDLKFKIAGGKPGMKVSWEITGIRHDAYADANRIPVEQQKPAAEQGSYLHPELFQGKGAGDQEAGAKGHRSGATVKKSKHITNR